MRVVRRTILMGPRGFEPRTSAASGHNDMNIPQVSDMNDTLYSYLPLYLISYM